jgi:hypothetical protein
VLDRFAEPPLSCREAVPPSESLWGVRDR